MLQRSVVKITIGDSHSPNIVSGHNAGILEMLGKVPSGLSGALHRPLAALAYSGRVCGPRRRLEAFLGVCL